MLHSCYIMNKRWQSLYFFSSSNKYSILNLFHYIIHYNNISLLKWEYKNAISAQVQSTLDMVQRSSEMTAKYLSFVELNAISTSKQNTIQENLLGQRHTENLIINNLPRIVSSSSSEKLTSHKSTTEKYTLIQFKRWKEYLISEREDKIDSGKIVWS